MMQFSVGHMGSGSCNDGLLFCQLLPLRTSDRRTDRAGVVAEMRRTSLIAEALSPMRKRPGGTFAEFFY